MTAHARVRNVCVAHLAWSSSRVVHSARFGSSFADAKQDSSLAALSKHAAMMTWIARCSILTKIYFDRNNQNRKFGSNGIHLQQFAHVKKYIKDIIYSRRMFQATPASGGKIR